MRRRSERLKKIVALAEMEALSQSRELRQAQQALQTASQRLHELTDHQSRYSASALPTGSIGAARWDDYQQFLARLALAVRIQGDQVRESERILESRQSQWREKSRRLEMLQEIAGRYRNAEARQDERSMQQALDDLSSTMRHSFAG